MFARLKAHQFWQASPVSHLLSAVAVAFTTLVLFFLHGEKNLANVFMIFILAVIVTALQLGSLPAVLAAFLAFLSIDYFFVEPRFSLTIAEPTEWLGLAVFMVVAMITGQLTARLRTEVKNTLQHDADMTALAETSWQVASCYDNKAALDLTLKNMSQILSLGQLAIILWQEDRIYVHSSFGLDAQAAKKLLQEPYTEAINFVRQNNKLLGLYGQDYQNSEITELANKNYENSPGFSERAGTFIPLHIDGTVQGVAYICSANDIVPDARARQMLQALINHLILILQREKSFAAEARAQALLEADKLKTALLSMVSHDFRSPLTSIKANMQTLRDTELKLSSELAKTLLDGVEFEAERINKMVTNILALSRLEAGAWGPKYEIMPISELIGSVLSSFTEQENARIVVKNEVTIDSVSMDSVQIEQVLKNLIENALKYSATDKSIELNCKIEGANLTLSVLDQGIGLPPGEEEKVFETFYRGQKLNATSGLGLGLSICKGLVEAHGGNIRAEKRSTGGSIFTVNLPNRQPNHQIILKPESKEELKQSDS